MASVWLHTTHDTENFQQKFVFQTPRGFPGLPPNKKGRTYWGQSRNLEATHRPRTTVRSRFESSCPHPAKSLNTRIDFSVSMGKIEWDDGSPVGNGLRYQGVWNYKHNKYQVSWNHGYNSFFDFYFRDFYVGLDKGNTFRCCIYLLNRLGFRTVGSCSGHAGRCCTFINFYADKRRIRELENVLPSGWRIGVHAYGRNIRRCPRSRIAQSSNLFCSYLSGAGL